jgi:hypothetical protein
MADWEEWLRRQGPRWCLPRAILRRFPPDGSAKHPHRHHMSAALAQVGADARSARALTELGPRCEKCCCAIEEWNQARC